MIEQGMVTHLMDEIAERGLRAVVDDAVEQASRHTRGIFISVEIGVADPGMGTGTPEPGGIPPRELLDTVRRLSPECVVVGAYVVEVSSPYDGPGQATAFFANRVVLEILDGMAERRTGWTS